MVVSRLSVLALAVVALAACGRDGSASGPRGDVAAMARAFDHVADSVAGAPQAPGDAENAAALHHVAALLRAADSVTPVTITIDGVAHSFLAVAEQIDFPRIRCLGPPIPVEPSDTVTNPCPVDGSYSVRTLIAWDPNDLQRVVRIMADGGSSSASPTGPDVMAHLPVDQSSASALPDTSHDGAAFVYPGFLGEYFVRGEGLWFSVSGEQSNALLAHGGACAADTLAVDWARFTCERATIQFSFSMHVVPEYIIFLGSYAGPERPPHDLAMSTTAIAGVHLTFSSWEPPPPVPPDSDSTFVIDTTITDTTSTGELRATIFAAPDSTAPGEVLAVFTVSNPSGEDVALEFPSGQTHDIAAYDTTGTLVWSSSMGILFTQGSQTVTLPAFGLLRYTAHWPASAAHGNFTIVGRLTSSNHPLQANSSLHLP